MSYWITADGLKSVGPFDTADSAGSTLGNIQRPTDAVQYALQPAGGFSIIHASGSKPAYAIAEFE